MKPGRVFEKSIRGHILKVLRWRNHKIYHPNRDTLENKRRALLIIISEQQVPTREPGQMASLSTSHISQLRFSLSDGEPLRVSQHRKDRMRLEF